MFNHRSGHSITVKAAERTHNFFRTIPAMVYMMWATIIVLAIIGLVADIAEGHTTPTDHACFKAADWGPAPDSVRPCVKLTGNAPQAGDVRFKVSDASGVVRYTGYVSTVYNHVAAVYVRRVEEDGSFRYCVSNYGGRMLCDGVSNLLD